MSKRFKVLLMIVLTALCTACLAVAGCKVGRPSRADETKGYNIHVVYYANGGRFDGMDRYVRELYVKCNEGESSVAFFNITPDSESSTVSYTDYDFVGWYFPQKYSGGEHDGEIMYTYTDAAGNTHPAFVKRDDKGNILLDSEARPVYVAEGVTGDIEERYITVVPSSTAVPASYMIDDYSDIAVCAVWKPSLKVLYKLVCEDGKTYLDEGGNSYTNGSVLDERSFGNSNLYTPVSTAPKQLKGATFAKSFLDENLTRDIETITRPEGVNGEDPESPVIYCHYIDGDWEVVTSPSEAVRMFNSLNDGKKYYLYNDVSLSGRSVTVNNNKDTTATIQGNGNVISDISITSASLANGSRVSLLGNIKESASVTDVTFKNIKFDITARGSIEFYAIFLSMEEGAQVSDVVIDGVDAKVNASDRVTNVPDFDNAANWLFGGLALGTTDSEFLAANADKITSIGENKIARR